MTLYFIYLILIVYNEIPDEGALAICDALENRKQHLEEFYMGKLYIYYNYQK